MTWARQVLLERWAKRFVIADYRKGIHWLQLHFELKRSDSDSWTWYGNILTIQRYLPDAP